jgi:hypothetical protein
MKFYGLMVLLSMTFFLKINSMPNIKIKLAKSDCSLKETFNLYCHECSQYLEFDEKLREPKNIDNYKKCLNLWVKNLKGKRKNNIVDAQDNIKQEKIDDYIKRDIDYKLSKNTTISIVSKIPEA